MNNGYYKLVDVSDVKPDDEIVFGETEPKNHNEQNFFQVQESRSGVFGQRLVLQGYVREKVWKWNPVHW